MVFKSVFGSNSFAFFTKVEKAIFFTEFSSVSDLVCIMPYADNICWYTSGVGSTGEAFPTGVPLSILYFISVEVLTAPELSIPLTPMNKWHLSTNTSIGTIHVLPNIITS